MADPSDYPYASHLNVQGKFCVAAPDKKRPKDFTAKERSQQTYNVWKRDKK